MGNGEGGKPHDGRLREIFERAIDLPEDRRAAYLDEACAGDDELRARVERMLLSTDAEGPDTVSEPGDAGEPTPGPRERKHRPGEAYRGRRIGPYVLTRRLGEGGMGEVWEAERREGVRMRVAIKLIRPNLIDVPAALARFEAERQWLAAMDHPNIARVFDAGQDQYGYPYFVMEYIKGEPITRYCDRYKLSTRERIELMIQVCEGVQHAHQKRVIHRDLKPGNVLIEVRDDVAIPKIIDFGVVRAIDRPIGEEQFFTEFGQIIGTLEYMAPEQAEMGKTDIDTRVDVYALGVMLYELISGRLPFDSRVLREKGYDGARRHILEVTPPLPSTRISALGEALADVAQHRRSDPRTLAKSVEGDIDWVTMKALEKDRRRRYASASAFGEDLRRYLNDEPVSAGPPSVTYRARKFVRRHRTATAATVVVALSLVTGATLATVGMVRAQRAEARARYEATTANEVIEFLVALFEESDPGQSRGATLTAREVLDHGVETIRDSLEERPAVRARLLEVMGRVYRALGLYDRGESALQWSVSDYREATGSESEEVAGALNTLGGLIVWAGEPERAEDYFGEALAIQRVVLPSGHREIGRTLSNLGNVYLRTGRLEAAEATFREALTIRELALGPNDDEVLRTVANLGYLYGLRKEFDVARGMLARVVETRARTLGTDHPAYGLALANLGNLERQAGRAEDARVALEEAVVVQEKALPPDHPDLATTLNNLAILDYTEARLDDARARAKRALEIRERVFGVEHEKTLKSVRVLRAVEGKAGNQAEWQRLTNRMQQATKR